MLALGCASALNDGSTASTSGSLKYVVGAPRGLKSRGGVVIVVGGAGATGGVAGAWARAIAGNATAPMPAAAIRPRRDKSWALACFVMRAPPKEIVLKLNDGNAGSVRALRA